MGVAKGVEGIPERVVALSFLRLLPQELRRGDLKTRVSYVTSQILTFDLVTLDVIKILRIEPIFPKGLPTLVWIEGLLEEMLRWPVPMCRFIGPECFGKGHNLSRDAITVTGAARYTH